jgi:FMN phosphatase YigB (HAD superfamily)
MVGDDPVLDMSAADVGMKTFYVGDGDGVRADYRGTLSELADLVRRTC